MMMLVGPAAEMANDLHVAEHDVVMVRLGAGSTGPSDVAARLDLGDQAVVTVCGGS